MQKKNIAKYEAISKEAEIPFYSECGLLIFGMEGKFMRITEAVASRMETPLEHIAAHEITKRFPFLGVPQFCSGLYQTTGAGYLSPRLLLKAQIAVGAKSGLQWVHSVVEGIDPLEGGSFVVKTASGQLIFTEQVLVCAGVFTSLLPLLPAPALDVCLTGVQALLVELSPKSLLELRDMPILIYEGPTDKEFFYLLPPIEYPNGKSLLKIGPAISALYNPTLTSLEEVHAWFKQSTCTEEFVNAMVQHSVASSRMPRLWDITRFSVLRM